LCAFKRERKIYPPLSFFFFFFFFFNLFDVVGNFLAIILFANRWRLMRFHPARQVHAGVNPDRT
jgi:predicted PurR-regulated permease PerM